jgi:hypothetical protein
MLQLNTYLLDSKNIMVYVIEIDYDVRLRKNLYTKKSLFQFSPCELSIQLYIVTFQQHMHIESISLN